MHRHHWEIPENCRVPGRAPGNRLGDSHTAGRTCQMHQTGAAQRGVPGQPACCLPLARAKRPDLTQEGDPVFLQQLWQLRVFRGVSPASPHRLAREKGPREPLPPRSETLPSPTASHSARGDATRECPFFPTRLPQQRAGRPGSGCYLDWDPLGDVHDQLHVGVVVVVGPPGDRHVVICHFDVLWRTARGRGEGQSPECCPSPPSPNPPSHRGGGKAVYCWIWLHRRDVCDPQLCRAPHVPGSRVGRSNGLPQLSPRQGTPRWAPPRNYPR